MKTLIISLLAGTLTSFAGEKVLLNQLPQPAQNALNASRGADTIKTIEMDKKDGKTVYEVRFDTRGPDAKVLVAEDGTIVRDTRGKVAPDAGPAPEPPGSLGRVASLHLNEVPEAVRKTIEARSEGKKVVDIDKETWKNQTVYEVEFAETGRNTQLYIGEDGRLIKTEVEPSRGLFGLYFGTQFEDTPAAVQKVITEQARGREIADIDKETREGKIVYEVEFKQPGRNAEVQIAADGTVLKDNDKTRPVGAPGQVQSETARAENKNLLITDVPAAVQKQIELQSEGSSLKGIRIEAEPENGKQVFKVELEKDGLNRELKISPDGTVIKDDKH